MASSPPPAQRHRVEKFLRKKSILIPDAKGKPTKQPKLPGTGKKAPRCYELRVPADGSDSALFPRKKPKVASGGKPKVTQQGKLGRPGGPSKTKGIAADAAAPQQPPAGWCRRRSVGPNGRAVEGTRRGCH